MSFPSADEVAAFLLHLRLTGIQRLVTEARPELTELTVVAGLPLALTIELPASPAGYHNRVVLASARGGYMPHWLIVGSRTYDLVQSAWDFETADSQLRDALLAIYDACIAKSEIATPWRWAEASQSTVVSVADGLTKGGLDVEGVVSSNRLMPDKFDGAGKPHRIPTNFGDALRIKMSWGLGTLARKATLGWVFDANDHLVTRRIDFARYVTGTISPSPGFTTDDVNGGAAGDLIEPRGENGVGREAVRVAGEVGEDGLGDFLRELGRAWRFRDHISFFLATGHLGVEWYRRARYHKSRIFPWGYFVPGPQTEQPEEVGEGRFRFCFAGQLVRRKGPDILVRAAEALSSREWTLDVIGDGPLAGQMKRAEERLGRRHVRCLGVLPHKKTLNQIGQADMLILPSRWDGWGAVINEALELARTFSTEDSVKFINGMLDGIRKKLG
jgi:hypothetical protein